MKRIGLTIEIMAAMIFFIMGTAHADNHPPVWNDDSWAGVTYAPDRLLVTFKEDLSREEIEAIVHSLGAEVLYFYDILPGTVAVQFSPWISVWVGIEKLQQLFSENPNVQEAEFDRHLFVIDPWLNRDNELNRFIVFKPKPSSSSALPMPGSGDGDDVASSTSADRTQEAIAGEVIHHRYELQRPGHGMVSPQQDPAFAL